MQKHLGHILGMFVFGLLALAVVAWLMEIRVGRPVAPAADVQAVGTGGAMPADAAAASALARLAAGTALTIEGAETALARGRRAEATHALDAALRATEVGKHAAGTAASAFERAHHIVREARRALQNGRPTAAAEVLSGAGAALRRFRGTAPAPASLSRYEGGMVIDARGVRLGEVESFTVSAEGQRVARLRLGGWQDFMGFIDLGGEEVVVPLDRIVFGPVRTIGTTALAVTGR